MPGRNSTNGQKDSVLRGTREKSLDGRTIRLIHYCRERNFGGEKGW